MRRVEGLIRLVSRQPPAALDGWPRGFTGHVAHPGRSVLAGQLKAYLPEHSDGESSQLVHDQNYSGDVFRIDLCGRFETGAKSCAAARHQCVGVHAAAKKRVTVRLAPVLPVDARCNPPCEVCRNRYDHSSSACLS